MALTGKEKADIERTIRARRAELAAEVRQDVEKVRDEQYQQLAGTPATDIGDQSVADLLSDVDGAELSRDLRELRDLDAALARLGAESFGVCVDCGGDIGFERLSASPAAVRCFDCQRVHEKTFVQPGRPTL